jgi:hypothetical protein
MRKLVLLPALALPVLLGEVASAKLPPFSFEATPTHPRVGEPIALTMQCFDDVAHTKPWSSCFGQAGGQMAWVHPLDLEGALERSDWIAVEGRGSASGATIGTIVLSEPGAYVVRPLWRGWGGTMDDPIEVGSGYPKPIRIEVVEPATSIGGWAILVGAAGALAAGLAFTQLLRRRQQPALAARVSDRPGGGKGGAGSHLRLLAEMERR